MEGWIKLYRQVLDSDLWLDEKFTRGQAWADLLMLANYKESSFRKRGIKVSLVRGQIGKSLDELSKRWKWSIGKVKRFLIELEDENQILVNNSNVNQIITIVNYDKYQGDDNANETQIVSQTGTQTDAQIDTQTESQTGMQTGMQTVLQTESLTETSKKAKNLTPTHVGAYEADPDLPTCYDLLSNSQIWHEPFCMNNHLTPQQFADYLKRFFSDLQDRGETSKSEKDAKHHFASWFKLNKNKSNETDRKLSKSDKARNLFGEYESIRDGNSPYASEATLPDL